MVNDLARSAPLTTLRPSIGAPLPDGTDVEVWCRSYDTWVTGFAVIDTTPDGCRVRRHSDGAVLPALFPLHDVRRSH